MGLGADVGPQLRSQSLSVPYLDSDMQSRYFEFGEDTIIRADQYAIDKSALYKILC